MSKPLSPHVVFVALAVVAAVAVFSVASPALRAVCILAALVGAYVIYRPRGGA